MKKIQFTTIQKNANIEIIEIDSSFLLRVMRAHVALQRLENDAVKEKVDTTTGKTEFHISTCRVDTDTLKDVLNYAKPLLDDLVEGFTDGKPEELKYK